MECQESLTRPLPSADVGIFRDPIQCFKKSSCTEPMLASFRSALCSLAQGRRPRQASAGNTMAFHPPHFCMKPDKETREFLAEFIRTDNPYGLCWTIKCIAPVLCGRELPDGSSSIRRYENMRTRAKCYNEFKIPKKSGGERTIQAPEKDLKDIQKCLNFILSELWHPHDCAHGFTHGRSVVSGASMHVGHNYVFNTDIKDFFPSITLKRVRSALKTMGLPESTASFIAELATLPSAAANAGAVSAGDCVLPQGAPTSPILSNIVCGKMDIRLMGLAKRFGLTYTRYADDMTFSSPHNVYQEDGEFMKELLRIVSDNGFSLNTSKTRLMKRGARQEVTGLTVSSKVNVSRKWIKALRAEIHHYETESWKDDLAPAVRSRLVGKVNWLGLVRGRDNDMFRDLQARVAHLIYARQYCLDPSEVNWLTIDNGA